MNLKELSGKEYKNSYQTNQIDALCNSMQLHFNLKCKHFQNKLPMKKKEKEFFTALEAFF